MRIMYIACNPEGRSNIAVEREITELQKGILSGAGEREVVLHPFPYLQPTELAGLIADLRPDVLHFAAHGDTRSLVLHGREEEVELDAHTLSMLLSGVMHRPSLIVLNACSSSSMAALLADAGAADHVIGTDAAISNGNAITMASALYSRLALGATLQAAYETAVANLQLDGGRVSARLHSASSAESAERVRLVQMLDLLASFKDVDVSLANGLTVPDRNFRPERPAIRFVLAGVPGDARQTLVFSDDERLPTVKGAVADGSTLFRSKERPAEGLIVFPNPLDFYGDAHLHACVTTSDHKARCTSSTLVAAIRRCYFEQGRFGELPGSMVTAIEGSLASLRKYREGAAFP